MGLAVVPARCVRYWPLASIMSRRGGFRIGMNGYSDFQMPISQTISVAFLNSVTLAKLVLVSPLILGVEECRLKQKLLLMQVPINRRSEDSIVLAKNIRMMNVVDCSAVGDSGTSAR